MKSTFIYLDMASCNSIKQTVLLSIALFLTGACNSINEKGTGGKATGLAGELFTLSNSVDSIIVEPSHNEWNLDEYIVMASKDTLVCNGFNYGDTIVKKDWYQFTISHSENFIKVKFLRNSTSFERSISFLLNSSNRFERFCITQQAN